MKKILSLVLVLSMVLMLFSCEQKQTAQNETTKAENVAGNNTANTAEEDFSNYVPKVGRLTRNTISSEELNTLIQSKWSDRNRDRIYFDDLNTGLLALDRGDIDCFVTNESTIKYIMNQNPGKYSMYSPSKKCYEEYSMGALEKNKDIIDKIDNAIKELDDSDELWNIKLKNMDITNESNKAKMPYFDGADTYRVILTGDLPPMDYVNTSGEPVGFNVDLLTAIANKINVNFEIVTSNAASRFLAITSDKADIAFWTLKVASFDKDATEREKLEISVSNDDSKLTEFMNDVPEGIVTTRPYMIDPQACIFLKGSKYERYRKLDKKNEVINSDTVIKLGDYSLNIRDDYTKQKVSDKLKKEGVTDVYKKKDGTKLYIFSIDNNDNKSLEEFAESYREKNGGCIEDKTEEFGSKCVLHTYSTDRSGKMQLTKNYNFIDGDKIVGYSVIVDTKEVRLGNSDYYMNIPVTYGDAEDISSSGLIEDGEYTMYNTPDERFYPNIIIKRWDENSCNYNDMKLRLKDKNNNCDVTESYYNNLAKGGWTLDKYYDLQLKRFDNMVINKIKGENNLGINYIIIERLKVDYDDIAVEASITFADNERFISIILRQPQKHWRAYGEAIAQTIHKK